MAEIVPVSGVRLSDIANTFGAPRSGGRSHAGIDIFATRGTPVVAARGGTVVKSVASNTGLGGRRVTVRGDDGRYYYYAHMDQVHAPKGARVTAGQQLGTVGDTGNAKGTPPHLHFSIGQSGADDGAFNAYRELSGGKTVSHQGGGSPVQQGPSRLDEITSKTAEINKKAAAQQEAHSQRVMQAMERMQQGRARQRTAADVAVPEFRAPAVGGGKRSLPSMPGLTPAVARGQAPPRGGFKAPQQEDRFRVQGLQEFEAPQNPFEEQRKKRLALRGGSGR